MGDGRLGRSLLLIAVMLIGSLGELALSGDDRSKVTLGMVLRRWRL